MTQMSSARLETTARSCVTHTKAVPVSSARRRTSARIWPWIDTSSAVVGSSAMMTAGLMQKGDGDRHALTHAAGELVRIGVESLLRARDADLGEGIARASRATFRGHLPCARTAAIICVPILRTGLSVIIGSWKTMAI